MNTQLTAVFTEMGVPQADLRANSRLIDDLHLDEIDLIYLHSELELRLGLTITERQWKRVQTVADLQQYCAFGDSSAQPALS